MTREEAIAFFRDMNECTYGNLEAVDMAIKALKQEPCEDCVSRKAVLNTLNRIDSVLDDNRTVETYKELLIACYNDLPPVTPAHKTGRWIRNEERKPLKYGYELIIKGKCSNCGEVFSETYKMNYCPNCGARIGGEE